MRRGKIILIIKESQKWVRDLKKNIIIPFRVSWRRRIWLHFYVQYKGGRKPGNRNIPPCIYTKGSVGKGQNRVRKIDAEEKVPYIQREPESQVGNVKTKKLSISLSCQLKESLRTKVRTTQTAHVATVYSATPDDWAKALMKFKSMLNIILDRPI